jgi:2'-5' RNA ligase
VVYSLNVPVPDDVARLASGLAAECYTADVRTRHTLVCKRLGDNFRRSSRQAREALAGLGPFELRVAELASFDVPTSGAAPVVYLAVESPGLLEAHERLCDVFEPRPGLEGEEYDPHVTVARGGDAGDLLGRAVEPVTWVTEGLEFWDPENRVVVERLSLPA